jgi:hypothetical protein
MDFVFIDAAHSYEYVLRDSINAIKMLRESRGLLLWHDYASLPGVNKALDELYTTDARFSKRGSY